MPGVAPKTGFPDRRKVLFGRKKDLQYLALRTRRKGITAVVGRPQMGKSWLLTELARFLSEDCQPLHLVGFTESSGQTSDLLLRAVIDLYTRWLSNASYWEQARVVWNQQKSDLVVRAGEAVGTLFEKCFKLGGQAAEGIGTLVKQSLEGLASANRTLISGGVQLPQLQYDQAKGLIDLVGMVSKRPVAVILDQWEQSPSTEFEAKTLNAFLRHIEEWGDLHVFVGMRPEDPAITLMTELESSLPGTAELYELGLMRLDDERETEVLVAFLHQRVAATKAVNPQDLVEFIGGYPGVIYRWSDPAKADTMTSKKDLQDVARDAQAYRFRELEKVLGSLADKERRVAIRLALVPFTDLAVWAALKEFVLGREDEMILDELKEKNVLEGVDPPSYGHAKRTEAALHWLRENRKVTFRQERESLILAVAASVDSTNPEFLPHVATLAYFAAGAKELAPTTAALCESAASLFSGHRPDTDVVVRGAAAVRAERQAASAPLLAMGLLNALYAAKNENELARRDALLEELRQLGRAFPNDAAVREQLAMSLFNTLNDAKDENRLARCYALLEELRHLARTFPEDGAVREPLAQGLVNTLVAAKHENELARRDVLLEELRQLARAYPNDSAAREGLARGLYNTLADENQPKRRNVLLKELRQLARAYPNDAAVREGLARSLVSTLDDAKNENQPKRRDALLEELRQLARTFPEDAAARERLVRGLVSTLLAATKDENASARRDALLEELRRLARAFPNDAAVREGLAMGLFGTLLAAKDENASARRDALLEELRQLARAFPNDASILERLAKGLFSTLVAAKDENQLARRDALLEELRQLARAFPNDASMLEGLARGLFSTLVAAKDENQLARRDALVEELRQLASAYADNAAVRKQLAMGLSHTLAVAKDENELARRDSLLEELRQLTRTFPEDAAARKGLAMGLFNTLNDAKDENALARWDALLEELRQLTRAYADDAAVRKQLAMGLLNTLTSAKDENQLDRRDALLEELRQLARAHPNDAAARKGLAMGLSNTLIAAKDENQPKRRDALLKELRQLVRAFPNDVAVLEPLAKGLAFTLLALRETTQGTRQHGARKIQELAQELQTLLDELPQDSTLRAVIHKIFSA